MERITEKYLFELAVDIAKNAAHYDIVYIIEIYKALRKELSQIII